MLAIARPPAEAASAYRAMVEENDVRAGLSYYERARIAVRAAQAGVFADGRTALSTLFPSASRPRRSKIGAFMRIVQALDGSLAYPTALSERVGLALAAALDRDETLDQRLISALGARPPASAEAEAKVIAGVIAGKAAIRGAGVEEQSVGALRLRGSGKSLTLRGDRLADPDFRARLLDWIATNSL